MNFSSFEWAIDNIKSEEEKTFTLDDLKVGYVVKLRNGKLRMVSMIDEGEIIVDKNGYWDYKRTWGGDLRRPGIEELDIVEVYGYSCSPSCSFYVETKNRRLLWKREEAKKMTVAEIEKKLGYKVEIVAE